MNKKNLVVNIMALFGLGASIYVVNKNNKCEQNRIKQRLNAVEKKSRKSEQYQRVYVALLREYYRLKDTGYKTSIKEKMGKEGIESIAIYGCGQMGMFLSDILTIEKIEVKAFIETKPGKSEYKGIPIYAVDSLEGLESVDCIIVTPFYEFDSIQDELYSVGRDDDIRSITSFI